MGKKHGKVYIVGAGPGDPELISIKGLNAVKKADCVVYDFLSNSELLGFAKKSAEKICVGKKDGLHLFEQNMINRLLCERAKRKKCIVRLKGGDPFIFSRGIEEALYLKRKGVDFEVVPGVTSAFGAPESFGIPLTRKGKFSSVAVLTGRKSSKEPIDTPGCDTLVYLMAVENIKNVVAALFRSGRPGTTPCAFIERATLPKERIVEGVLNTIIKKACKYNVRPPAVFIVGKVVKYGKRIYGHKFKNK